MNRHAPIVLGLALFFSHSAHAQDVAGFDAHMLQVAALDGDPRDPLLVQRPGRFRGGEFFGGAVFEFAQGLLMQTTKNGDGSVDEDPLLTNVFAANLSVGVAVHDRVRFDLAMPIVLYSRGLDGPNGVQPGDLRGTAMIALVRPKPGDVGFGLGLQGHVDAPTGNAGVFLGQRTIAEAPGLSTTYAVKRFTLSADAGVQFNPKTVDQNLRGSDAFQGGLGLGVLLDDNTGLTLEGRTSVPFVATGHPGSETPAEVLLHVRHHWKNGAYLLGGGAMGVSPGVGAGAWRVFLGAGYGRIEEDGPCPGQRETMNGWKDDDGCPDELASLDVTTTWNGAPVVGATVALHDDGSSDHSVTSAAGPVRVDGLMPLSTWHGLATDDCLEGHADVVLGGEGSVNTMPVAMVPVRDAIVIVHVVDGDHKGIPGVQAEWKETAKGCIDQSVFTLDTMGSGQQNVGAGTHDLFVSAPGFERVERDVVVPRTGQVVVEIVLGKTHVTETPVSIDTLEEVHFEFDKDVIMSTSYALLDEVAATIKQHGLSVEVGGHTDWIGSDEYNDDLSDRRAKSVIRYLISKGVKASQIVERGYGETMPEATNETDEGRAINRRVHFTILTGQ